MTKVDDFCDKEIRETEVFTIASLDKDFQTPKDSDAREIVLLVLTQNVQGVEIPEDIIIKEKNHAERED